ncbi:unnamed protein product [Somion occarium]|uniref:Protein kinase domain-containing protein n=1 Tax=Somion occarium TaxID=3059160 RepID=A0ABP1D7S4_9APHY
MANQIIKPILGAAQIAGDFGVPYIGGAAGLVKGIQDSAEKVIAHRHECKRLGNKAGQLLQVFEEQGPRLKESDLRVYADEMESILLKVHTRMQRWAQLGRVRAFLQDAKIAEQIKNANSDIDTTISKFQMHSLITIQTVQERVEANVTITHRTVEEFLTRFATSPAQAADEVRQLERVGQEIAIPLMEEGQRHLRFIREQLPAQPKTINADGGTSAPKPTYTPEYLQIQHGLTELYKRMGIPPTVKHLDGEVIRDGDIPVAGGTYSDVWIGWWLGETKVALKALRGVRATATKAGRRFERELKVWSKLSNPHILSFLGLVTDIGNFLHMVSPWQDNGNILEFVKKHEDADRHHLLTGAVQGLAYLHEQGVVHGNMKCSNILVSAEAEALICDFGMSKLVEDVTEQSASATLTKQGSARWLAPEVIEGLVDSPTMACDVYSFGMTMFECFSTVMPFAKLKRDAQVIHKVIGEKMRPGRPETNPADRPTMDVVVQRMVTIERAREATPKPSPDEAMDVTS